MLREAQLAVSNVVEGAPPGGEDDYIVLREVGKPPEIAEPRDHVELGELLGAIDVDRGAKVSGSRFYFLTGPGALLELALVQLAMAQAVAAGFVPMIPPALVKPEAMEGTGFLGAHSAEVYRLEADDLWLVGTSRGRVGGLPRWGGARRRPAAAAVRRVFAMLPARGRFVRQGHPRHHPRAPVRQGRDVLVQRSGGRRRRSTCGCWPGRSSSCRRWSFRTA